MPGRILDRRIILAELPGELIVAAGWLIIRLSIRIGTTDMSKAEELVRACFTGHLDLVRSLVEEGVKINAVARNWNSLHAAIENEQIAIINYLLASGADVEYLCGGMRPLHHAIDLEVDAASQADEPENANTIFTQLLIDAGANIKGTDSSGRTPLQMAIERGHKQAEKLLRSRGAD